MLTKYKSDKPFFIGMYTAGTHHGVDSPDLTYGDGSNSYYNKFHNLDHWLGDFIAWFQRSPYYDNTLLVITSDHGVVIPTPNTGGPSIRRLSTRILRFHSFCMERW